jgi:pimeloyl-ACP methyl ester carboxylesterase
LTILIIAPAAVVAATKALRWAKYVDVGVKGIVEVESVPLRGTDHYLFLRGEDREKPVLLFLPGGPGESVVPLAQEFSGQLMKHFVVAHVEFAVGKAEQYEATPSLDEFIADGEGMVDHLRSRFGGRVYLVGHSLGSVQALRIAQRSPEKIAAVASIGQTADWRRGNALTANHLRQMAAARQDMETVREITSLPPTLATAEDPTMIDFAAVKKQRDLLRAYGMENVLEKHTAEARWWAYLTAPTHTISESCNLMYEEGGLCARITGDPNWWHQWSGLIPGILQFNAAREVPVLRTPYTAIVGSNDWITPAQLTKEYVARLNAPSKRFLLVEGAGHYAHLDKPQEVQQLILEAFGGK